MTVDELKDKIRSIIRKQQILPTASTTDDIEYDEISRFPELKQTIVDLLTVEYNMFLSSIDWVSPKPTTFRINLKNDQNFYLIFGNRSWIAEVEGKSYYLANLPEAGRASDAIARILRYGSKEEVSDSNDGFEDFEEPSTDTPEDKPEDKPEEE